MSRHSQKRTRKSAVESEYSQLAAAYNERWRDYIEQSNLRVVRWLEVHDGWDSLLDLGCGTGYLLSQVARQWPVGQITGVDLSPEMLAVARRKCPDRVRLIPAEAEHLPFSDHAFDRVVSASVFHYLPDPEKALREWHRVLSPQGKLLLVAWNADTIAMRLRRFWYRTVRSGALDIHSSRRIQEMLEAAGFQVTQSKSFTIAPAWSLSEFQCQLPQTSVSG